MTSYLVIVAVLFAAFSAIVHSQLNFGSALGFLQQNPQAFGLLSQALGGSQNAQAAANGQCVNSENMLANTLLCAIAGKQCGANMANNPLANVVQSIAGGLTSSITGLIGSNPVICIIVKQSCCMSQTGNGASLGTSLAGLLLGGGSGNSGTSNLIGSLVGGLAGGQQQGGGSPNFNAVNSLLPSFLGGRPQ